MQALLSFSGLTFLYALLLTVAAGSLICVVPDAVGKVHTTLSYLVAAIGIIILLVVNIVFFALIKTNKTVNAVADIAVQYVDGAANLVGNTADALSLDGLSLSDIGGMLSSAGVDTGMLASAGLNIEDLNLTDILDSNMDLGVVKSATSAGANMAVSTVQGLHTQIKKRLHKYLAIDIIVALVMFILAGLLVYTLAENQISRRAQYRRSGDSGSGRSGSRGDGYSRSHREGGSARRSRRN